MADCESEKAFREFVSEFIDGTGADLVTADSDPVMRVLELGNYARADALLQLLGMLQAVVEADPAYPVPVSVIEEQTRRVLAEKLASLDRQLTERRSMWSAFVDKETTGD